ncbi:hypothetical protein DFQ28_002608 [Apophysomyces sp. BC1034]|nr:hypothetical protein DFQ28_002608 [Apophysomyces sp. BC1034]
MSQIPVELLNIVASFLLSKELHTCSCVCRYWFSIFRVAIQRAKVFIKTSEQLHSFVLRHDPQLFPPGQLIRELRLRRTFNLQPGDLEQIQRHYPMVEVFEVGQDYGTIGHPDYYRLFQWWPHLRRTPQISKYSDDLVHYLHHSGRNIVDFKIGYHAATVLVGGGKLSQVLPLFACLKQLGISGPFNGFSFTPRIMDELHQVVPWLKCVRLHGVDMVSTW